VTDLCKMLLAQSKLCQTASGAGMLLAVKGHMEGREVFDGCSELWQVADDVGRKLETNSSLATAFRELRNAWFNSQLRSHPHEREWENEGAEVLRESRNSELKAQYDRQTEVIVVGLPAPVCPTCAMDMEAPP